MSTFIIDIILFQTIKRPLIFRSVFPYVSRNNNNSTVNPQIRWPSRFSSTAGKNLKTFHSSNKKPENSGKVKRRSKYRTLFVLMGFTIATSVVSILFDGKGTKPREFLE